MPQTVPVRVVPRGLTQLGRWCAALLVSVALSLGMIIEAHPPTTWRVCASGCDYASINAAIAAPPTLDGDTLAIAAGTYTEAGITLTKSLTLQGEEAATTIVQAAETSNTASDRVFTIPSRVTVTFQDLTIRHGRRSENWDEGGGISNEGTLTLANSTISRNATSGSPSWGGGLFNRGTLTLIHSTISDNAAPLGYGGGLANRDEGTVTLTASTISDNAANSGGGLLNSGTLTLTNSTISGNTATPYGHAGGYGGGLYNYGSMTLTASTVSGNAAAYGGGLFNNGEGRVTLTASTVSGNAAEDGGGLLNNSGAPLTLTNSLVAQNPDGGDCHNGYYWSLTSTGYNLDSDGSCQLTAPTDRPGIDPRLGPLQDNGGPTFTHALLPGSPAIDAIPWGTNGCGTTLSSDQRWQARPQLAGGNCDIGAYEVEVAGQALSAWVSGVSPHTAVCENVTTGHTVTLNDPASPWDCEAEGLVVTWGDQVALRVRGPVTQGAKDVGGAVVGMAPRGGDCTNRTTGQQVKFQALFQGEPGATAASCVAAGLGVHPGDQVQMHVRGTAE